jgi:hypothetical protein
MNPARLWRSLRVIVFRNLLAKCHFSRRRLHAERGRCRRVMVSLNAGPLPAALTPTASSLPVLLPVLPRVPLDHIVDRREPILFAEAGKASPPLSSVPRGCL